MAVVSIWPKAWRVAVILLCATCVFAHSIREHRLAGKMQRKLDHIRRNGASSHVSTAPTTLSQDEINDYVAAGGIKLPTGVEKVTFQGQQGAMTVFATVDFDQIRAGRHSINPLLYMFTGVHDVRVDADAFAAHGEGRVHIRSVSLDGVDVPHLALQYFLSKYVTPKYPEVGMDSRFELSDRIDTAEIGYHKLTVTQR